MMNKKVFSWQMIFLGIMGIFIYTLPVQASVFEKAYEALYGTFVEARTVVYVMGGFGLIGFATAAIFGKLSWRWLAMIATALFTLAMAEKIVLYAVGADTSTPTSNFSSALCTETTGPNAFCLRGYEGRNEFNNPKDPKLHHEDARFKSAASSGK